MKTFLINLDRDKDRLQSADVQLKSLGIEYERIPAVYGKALSENQKRKAVSFFRWWCAVGIPPRDGEIGCALSHLAVYQRIVDLELSCACILEDDVILDHRFPDILKFIESSIAVERPQVCLLSNHSDSAENTAGGDSVCGYRSAEGVRFILKRSPGDSFTEGYVINNMAARSLIRQNTPVKIFADAWRRWVRNGAIELFHALPTVCSQDKANYESTTILRDLKFDVARMSPIRWTWHKFKRLIGVSIDKVIMAFVGR